jgi:ABC-2 type transport system ATP-binding protein
MRGGPADVEVRGLTRTFRVPVREPGLRAAARALVRRRYREVTAVRDVSFDVAPGEVVGFLGPNGAGKTTTLKMLTGLLHPTSGEARVLGHVPWRRDADLLRRLTLVMGNRNQLQWDLPVADSFEINRAIYRLPRPEFESTRDQLVELLDIGDLLTKPVRNLSLGERMKAEIAGALLHLPQVLFLDEPTIGLDVTMQKRIRAFLAEYNARFGATVMLTSHYMADVEALCRRVVLLAEGRILFDGGLRELATRLRPDQTLTVTFTEDAPAPDPAAFGRYGEVVAVDGARVSLRVDRGRTSQVAAAILGGGQVTDVTIEDAPLEDVIEQAFAGAKDGAKAGAKDGREPVAETTGP